ncbi:1,4-dihydroxy-2-naphthoate octaprenyltransferase [Marinobacterium sediminicola]|uniref:1,4-dihydroxy-2-naphthoate octaprenyltransferase n=2 Tax=Marinobacterium sediminicola TaxID=518898 RepID=A0ABY1RXY8_9GAMM|nr:1,4-dihydroxy-2-naphthoate octaprenyltransferase [Marinobacterium sediminicola]
MSYTAPQDLGKYAFFRALRPFSFPVALVTCLIGILLAAQQQWIDPVEAVMVLIGGVLLQAGVNLINDHADIKLLRQQSQDGRRIEAIRRNFRVGMLCFLLAAAIGFHFVIERGLGFLLLCLLGLIGALGYTVSPINYKNRGLGVILVFWLMGVLMIAGSAVALGASISLALALHTLPVSLLVSLLLLSNELRDYETDRRDGLQTLAVKIGYQPAVRIYFGLMAAAYLVVALLMALGLLPGAFWLLLSLPLALKPVGLLQAPAGQRGPLTPATARLLLGFGVLFCVALADPWPLSV